MDYYNRYSSRYYYIYYYDSNNRQHCEAVFADSPESAIRKIILRHIGENIAVTNI